MESDFKREVRAAMQFIEQAIEQALGSVTMQQLDLDTTELEKALSIAQGTIAIVDREISNADKA